MFISKDVISCVFRFKLEIHMWPQVREKRSQTKREKAAAAAVVAVALTSLEGSTRQTWAAGSG